MDPLIEITDFSFTYHRAKTKAVESVNLEVHKGEFLAIIGPTGSGKTTICRSIVGLAPQLYEGKMAGSLKVLGKPVQEYSVRELASVIGYVHQDAESQILMTNIEKEIVFPLENLALPREEIKDRLEKALHLVHLEEYRNRHPFYLSGGQRQRVVLATALAMNPDVLILDEAVSEIDPLGAQEIITLAKELNDQGKTIIFIEHNMEEISQFADNIMVMEEGKTLTYGKTSDILTNMDLLKRLEIYPPEVTQLFIELSGRGIQFDKIPINIEDASNMLHDMFRKKQKAGDTNGL